MNCVIFITKHNLPAMLKFADEIAAKQTKPISGALVVLKPTFVRGDEGDQVLALTNKIGRFFERRELLSVMVGNSLPPEAAVAAMMATFMMQRYFAYPGNWLVIDAETGVRCDNPLSVMYEQHQVGGLKNSGRATADAGRVPIGPVVIGFNKTEVKTLARPSGESWRTRGRYLFARAPFYTIPADVYPFVLTGDQGGAPLQENRSTAAKVGAAIVEGTQVEGPVVVEEAQKPEPPVMIGEDGPQAAEVELKDSGNTGEPPPEYDYDAMSDDELKHLFHIRTGREPRNTIKRTGLLKALKVRDVRH